MQIGQKGSPSGTINRDDGRGIVGTGTRSSVVAAVIVVLGYFFPVIHDNAELNGALFVLLSVAIDAAYRYLTDTRVILPFWLISLFLMG